MPWLGVLLSWPAPGYWKEFGDQGLEVIAIDMFPRRNGLEEWRTYWQKYGDDVTWAQDTVDNNAAKAYRVQASGTTVIIDRAGQIVYRDARPTSCETPCGNSP